jgi:hypothetical protein
VEESQQGFIVFAKGIGDFDAHLLVTDFPILIVDSEEQASGIIGALKDTGYSGLEFSFQPFAAAAQMKRAAHEMLIDKALNGERGEIARELCKMAKEIIRRSGGHRVGEGNAGGSTTQAKQDDETADANDQPPAADPANSQPAPAASTLSPEAASDAIQRLLRLYAGNVVDERIRQAGDVLASDGTVNEKLEALHRALPIPQCSAQALATALGGGITKQAVAQSAWWKANRAGQQDEIVEARRNRLRDKDSRSDGVGDDE